MHHEIVHDLSQPTARALVRSAHAHYAQRFAHVVPELTWTSEDRATFAVTLKGLRLAGTLEVGPHVLRLELEVPWLLRPFQSRAIQRIDAEAARWIAQAKAGTL